MKSFRDRREAGEQLARKLGRYQHQADTVVVALPRGGTAVAAEVAINLALPLEVLPVCKFSVLDYEQHTLGAVATGGVQRINGDMVRRLHVPDSLVRALALQAEYKLARREALYLGGRSKPDFRGRTVILVDDGVVTGSSMRVALDALTLQQPRKLILAVPVAALEAWESLTDRASEHVCLLTPTPFVTLGRWYRDFPQIRDDQVQTLLEAFGTSRRL